MESDNMDRRKKYSLRAIRQAFLDLLAQKSLNSITVTEVCKLADINRGTFYKYYNDIDDLLRQISDSILDDIYKLMLSSSEEKNAENRDLHGLLNDALEVVLQNADILTMLKNIDILNVIVPKFIFALKPAVSELLEKMSPKLPENEAMYLTDFIMGGCGAIVQEWLRDGMTISKENIADMIYKNITGVMQAYCLQN